MSQPATEVRTLSQPREYWAAFAAAAKRSGQSRSAWVAAVCVAALPDDLREPLQPRRKPGRLRRDKI